MLQEKGFMDAIHKAKLEVVPERMKIGSFTMDSGYEMAKELFEEELHRFVLCVLRILWRWEP